VVVFVDEMGANTSLCALYAYSPKGERAHVRVPRNRRQNTTLLSSMTLSDLNPIEEAFSKITSLLRKAEARTREAITGSITMIWSNSTTAGSRA